MNRVEQPIIEIGQYWECTAAKEESDAYAPGDLGIVLGLETEHLELYSGEKDNNTGNCRSWINITYDEFYARFKPAPDGVIRRAKLLASFNDEILKAQQTVIDQQKLLAHSPLNTESMEPAVADAGEGKIIHRIEPQSMAKARENIGVLRNTVKKFKARAEELQNRLAKVAGEQALAMKARMELAQATIEKLQEGVHTFDVYLGKNEDILRLQRGKPASDDAKITIRQLTLYMDEEAAIAPDKGGLDFQSLPEFDKWITSSPEHLQQVLPEAKGIVALKPRRTSKNDRDDVWAKKAKDEANFKTYWLIRNGENLYRVCTVLEVGDHIIPFEDEYMDMFVTQRGEDLRPGSHDYMKMMEAAEAQKRHYMRILLLIQGLIDRTPVFKPYPHKAERINVMSERTHEEHIHYVYDADPKRLFGQTRPPFMEWLEELNQAKLEKGIRVIGVFDTWAVRAFTTDREGKNTRKVPQGAPNPEDLSIHTIERREKESFAFLYPYKVRMWDNIKRDYVLRESKTRAAWKIEPGDANVIPFDFVTKDDIEFYLHDRLSRSSYFLLFPLLQQILKVKEKESREEAPFLLLLTAQLCQTYEMSTEEAKAAVAELVPWYKFKNRTHRALSKNDAQALKMIVEEQGFRLEKNEARAALPHAYVVDRALERHPDALYIGHKTEREYVVLVPASPHGNVFVTEYTYALGRDGKSFAPSEDTRYWRTVDGRRLRWLEVYCDKAKWEKWNITARGEQFLTDPEIEQGVKELTLRLTDRNGRHFRHSTDEENRFKFRLLAVTFDSEQQRPIAYYQVLRPYIPRFADGNHHAPEVRYASLSWKRRKGEVVWGELDERHPSGYRHWWEGEDVQYLGKVSRVLFVDGDAIRACEADFAASDLFSKQSQRVNTMVDEVRDAIIHRRAKEVEAAAKQVFFAENNNDAELWDMEHKKTEWEREVRHDNYVGLNALRFLIARGRDVNGKTMQQVMEQATFNGWKAPVAKKREHWQTQEVPQPDRTPRDLVVKYTILPEVAE